MSLNFNWTLERIATTVQAQLVGTSAAINGVSTDTRTLKAGELFVVLRGPNYDAHDFAAVAVQRGAAAVLVERQLPLPVPQLVVADARLALGQLAAAWRQQFQIPVIAITGSNGKTTVKEMLAAICAQRGAVLSTQGNLNNDIGVPLTLLQINQQHQFAVIELGANHPREIAYLTQLVKPDVAVINNAGPAHLEGFGSLDGVAQAKGEIYSGLSANGIGIVNADDPYAPLWRNLCRPHRTISFGLNPAADVTAQWSVTAAGSHLRLRTAQGAADVQLHLLGQHNVMNALAASAAASAIDCTPEQIKQGLETVQPVKGRLQLKPGKRGSRIIDDTYNANPVSFKAALDVLQVFPGQHYVALGDMGELGAGTEQLHREVGAYAQTSGVHHLYTVGTFARYAAEGFGTQARVFAEQPQLISALAAELSGDVTLLVKGSRSTHMDNVVNALVQAEGG
jgi:UDP-N-acetylmuramoyl-tripeptide--D-alanyl-D-alanine ligase